MVVSATMTEAMKVREDPAAGTNNNAYILTKPLQKFRNYYRYTFDDHGLCVGWEASYDPSLTVARWTYGLTYPGDRLPQKPEPKSPRKQILIETPSPSSFVALPLPADSTLSMLSSLDSSNDSSSTASMSLGSRGVSSDFWVGLLCGVVVGFGGMVFSLRHSVIISGRLNSNGNADDDVGIDDRGTSGLYSALLI